MFQLIPDWLRALLARYLQIRRYYLGFDRNDYPGDENLLALRKTFSYSSYWLSNPPSEPGKPPVPNTWLGKRERLQKEGFGFLVLFNGRHSTALSAPADPTMLGGEDAKEAVRVANKEGFPTGTIIFLDQEEGGRLIKGQRPYIHAWVDGVNATKYHAGIYCSGVPNESDEGVITAVDIRDNAGDRNIVYWVFNGAKGRSPGCTFPKSPPAPSKSGVAFADVWQFALSTGKPKAEKEKEESLGFDPSTGNCYPPEFGVGKPIHVDVNTATSADPSHGRPSGWSTIEPMSDRTRSVAAAAGTLVALALLRRLAATRTKGRSR